MDYTQFLNMPAELSLLAVIVIVFIADLLLPSDTEADTCGTPCTCRSRLRTMLPVALMLVHTGLMLLPCSPVSGCEDTEAFGGMYVSTPMMHLVKSMLGVGVIIVMLMSARWLSTAESSHKTGEYHELVLFTLLGMYFMISSGHFLMFFIGLELASIPMTALVAYDKKRYESAEAGAKFILLALFSSALLLYGISLIYGITGSLYFDKCSLWLDGNLLSILALVLFISGMGFKISLVPFHLWTADTYEGAPTAVTGYLSVISKGSAAFVMLTVLEKVFGSCELTDIWNHALFWIIILSITLANLFAIRQQNLKRFMAFSAISQAGYLVLGLVGGTAQGMTALVFYLLVYMVANLGAFAVLCVVEQNSNKIGISDYNGLYTTNPRLAFLMTLCLFSLAGIPPFAGFFSKFFIFMAAFKAGFHLLVFIALINTIISLYYYLLIVKAMYINKNDAPIAPFRSDCSTRLALVLCTLGVVLCGLMGCIYNHIDTLSYGL